MRHRAHASPLPAPRSALPDAFTLIELLVVVSIIITLLAILLPSISGAIKAAERVGCQSNLHQFSVGNLSFASDRFGLVMRTSPRGWPYDIHYKLNGGGHYANMTDRIWSIEGINPYVTSFIDDNGSIDSTGIAVCPSIDTEIVNKWHYALRNNGRHVEIAYTYFGATDERYGDPALGGGTTNHNTIKNNAQDILMTSRIGGGANRIWMSDVLYRDRSDAASGFNPYRYNHGTTGWALNGLMWPGGQEVLAPPMITGLNQVMGDGHVRWKGLEDFEPQSDIEDLGKLEWAGPYIRAGQDVTTF